jgi:hypothetical protein
MDRSIYLLYFLHVHSFPMPLHKIVLICPFAFVFFFGSCPFSFGESLALITVVFHWLLTCVWLIKEFISRPQGHHHYAFLPRHHLFHYQATPEPAISLLFFTITSHHHQIKNTWERLWLGSGYHREGSLFV